MGRWLTAWLEYLQGLWMRGAFLLFVVACAAALGATVVGIGFGVVALALGLPGGISPAWLAVSALVWLPVMLGPITRSLGRFPPLNRPPSYSDWRAGAPIIP